MHLQSYITLPLPSEMIIDPYIWPSENRCNKGQHVRPDWLASAFPKACTVQQALAVPTGGLTPFFFTDPSWHFSPASEPVESCFPLLGSSPLQVLALRPGSPWPWPRKTLQSRYCHCCPDCMRAMDSAPAAIRVHKIDLAWLHSFLTLPSHQGDMGFAGLAA